MFDETSCRANSRRLPHENLDLGQFHGSISTDPIARGSAKTRYPHALLVRGKGPDHRAAEFPGFHSDGRAASSRNRAFPADPVGPGPFRRPLSTPRAARPSAARRPFPPPRRPPCGRAVTVSTACPIVCPKFNLRRSPVSRTSAEATRALSLWSFETTSARAAGSRGTARTTPPVVRADSPLQQREMPRPLYHGVLHRLHQARRGVGVGKGSQDGEVYNTKRGRLNVPTSF
jgi:hypothetical protein